MEKIIITGASGFIGGTLTKSLLDDGKKVLAIVKNRNEMKEFFGIEGLTIIEAYFEDYISLDLKIKDRDFDIFYHCAWNGTFGKSFKDYHKQMKNAAFSGDAAILATKLKCKKFVLLSTVVAFETKVLALKNESLLRTSCIYGSAKIAAEVICKIICYQNNISFNTAIISSVYGVGDRSKMIQNVVLLNLNRGVSPKLVEGKSLYDWIYIDDVVGALCAIGENGKNQKSYYIGHRNLRSFREIVEETGRIVNPSITLRFGEYPDEAQIDYTNINLNALYEDTGFLAGENFKENILKTSAWVKKLDDEGWFD